MESLDLRESVYALSDALDLVGVDDLQHGKRVALMAVECAHALHWPEATVTRLFDASLLHDCGVSSTRVHDRLITEFACEDTDVHCRVGSDLLAGFAPLADLAPFIRHHHTPWGELQRSDVSAQTALTANLIFMVDRVDAMLAAMATADRSVAAERVRAEVAGMRDSQFAPDLVDALLAVTSGEAFFMALEPINVVNFLWQHEKDTTPTPISMAEFRQFASLFAAIVDAKSAFTLRHSEGVARLARFLGEKLGFDAATCDRLEIAGLLHDLGKLQVPDYVLDKPGALSADERRLMGRHSFESFQVINRITGLHDVALWAAYHHERPDGAGYPFHRRGAELSTEARLVAVSDVFQALAQERPYRQALEPAAILSILRERALARRLDADLVELVAESLDECWEQAIGPEMRESRAA